MDETGPYDDVVLRLQELRRGAGDPSFAEMARLVAQVRVARGVSREAALPARTTVYDAFRLGRRRLDRDLVADLTAALEAEVARLEPTAIVAPDVEPASEDPDVPGATWRQRTLLVLVCTVINLLGLVLIDGLGIPIWLDMIGTAIVAITLGPWWGVGVALSSSLLDGLITGHHGYWFTPVTAAGALVWGYGVRTFKMARTAGRFFALNLVVALVSTALAAPITWLVFDGYPPHDSSRVTELLVGHLPWLLLAVLVSNLIFSMLDKLVSGFVALAAMDALAHRWPWLEKVLRG